MRFIRRKILSARGGMKIGILPGSVGCRQPADIAVFTQLVAVEWADNQTCNEQLIPADEQ